MLWLILLRYGFSNVSTKCEGVIKGQRWSLHYGRARIPRFAGIALPIIAHFSVPVLLSSECGYRWPGLQPHIQEAATQKFLMSPLWIVSCLWCFILQITGISADSGFDLGFLSSMRPPCYSQMPVLCTIIEKLSPGRKPGNHEIHFWFPLFPGLQHCAGCCLMPGNSCLIYSEETRFFHLLKSIL